MNGPAFDGRALLTRRSDSLRDANKRRIIRAVMMDPGTQVTISRHTHLSQATVSAAVNELVQEGVFVADTGEGERGKRVRLGPVRGIAVGVEVNHANVTVATRPVAVTEPHYATIDFGADQAANLWVRQTVRLIQETVLRTGMGPEHIVSIGIGIPASIDPRTSRITQVSSSLGWEMIGDPREQLERHFPHVPIIVDNEANMAAYGEYVHGAGQGAYETMLFVKASEGIGAGLIVGGLIYRGRHGVAGEMGHLTMDPEHGIVCRCGNRGCLETQVGGVSLIQQVQDSYRGFRIDSPTSLESMIERAKSGDPVCKRVLMDAARKMGLGLARVCNLMNPEVIVLGGELGLAADFLLPTIEYELQLHALRGMFNPDVAPTRIVGSELGRQAGARGALSFAVQVDRTIPA